MPKKKNLRSDSITDKPKTSSKVYIDFVSTCRVCLTNSGQQYSLFSPYKDSTISALINIIADVKIIEGDGLPDKICQHCIIELETSVNFKKRCEKSNVCLLQIAEGHIDTTAPTLEIKKEILDDIEFDTDLLYEDYDIPLNSSSQEPEEQTSENLLIKKQENDVVDETNVHLKSVQCHDCGGIFKSKCKLRVHWKNTHNTYICPSCKRLFKSPRAFNRHNRYSKTCVNPKEVIVEGVGKNRLFKCAHCYYETRALPTIRFHAYTHNGKKPYNCNSCPMSFNQISSLNAHKERRHNVNVKQIVCKYCGKVVLGTNKIYKHLKSHLNEKYQCDYCKKFMKSKQSLIGHLQRHSGIKSYVCELCGASYYTLAELCNHRRSRHTTRTTWHSCSLCSYKSHRKHGILKHQAKHTSTNIACQKCGIFFESASKLQAHFAIHGSEKKFSCPICLHMFHRKNSVGNHVRSKHKGQIIKPEIENLQMKQEVPG